MIADGAAIASAERNGLFACLAGFDAVVLAVSGGADSMAMLHLAASWAHDQGRSAPKLSVATVDHGLRPGSAAEARAVATIAAQLGLAYSTLTWTGAKPARGIQAAARTARYRLLAGHARAHRIDAVAAAHTLDDQAETLLMRLARGSGVDGLAAMQLQASIEGVAVLRPLLGIARARLRATLRQQGATWIDDPTNARPEFERVRWRGARGELDALGLTARPLGLAARRLGRARSALDAIAAACARPERGIVTVHPLGYAEIDWPALLLLPAEIRLRLLGRLIASIGGGTAPVSLAGLEAMTEGLGWCPPAGRTLGRVAFRVAPGNRVLLLREPGRAPPVPLLLAPGTDATFDGRFTVAASAALDAPITVAALLAGGLRQLAAAGVPRPAAPAAVLRMLPGFWRAERLVAAPLLGYIDTRLEAAHFGCAFTNRPFPVCDGGAQDG